MRKLFKFFALSTALILSSQALAGKDQTSALAASVPHESTICGNQNYALAA